MDQPETHLEKARQAAHDYMRTLYALIPCIDLSVERGPGKAHGILNMIEQIQKMQKALENPESTHEERKEAFDLVSVIKRGR